MNERTRDYYRHHRNRVINHKRRLLTKIYGYENGYDEFPIDGKLGKGKIYYSFPKRRKKVKIDGWRHSDLKQLIRIKDTEEWNGYKLRYT